MAKNMVCLFGVFCSGLFLSQYSASCKFNYYSNYCKVVLLVSSRQWRLKFGFGLLKKRKIF